jgi:hypothetical protein
VVPHYDNREGGTHDTRFCYMGGRRLSRIEPELDGAFILGVDEHTALLLDLDARTASVAGRGGVTLRVRGVEHVLPTGTQLAIDELEQRVRDLASGATGEPVSDAMAGSQAPPQPAATEAAAAADPAAAQEGSASPAELAATVLAGLPDGTARERAALVELAERAEEASLRHSRGLASQLVQALVDARSGSRQAGDWEASDRIREILVEVGVEVRDSKEGSTWDWM